MSGPATVGVTARDEAPPREGAAAAALGVAERPTDFAAGVGASRVALIGDGVDDFTLPDAAANPPSAAMGTPIRRHHVRKKDTSTCAGATVVTKRDKN
jgi:hypothetical protein